MKYRVIDENGEELAHFGDEETGKDGLERYFKLTGAVDGKSDVIEVFEGNGTYLGLICLLHDGSVYVITKGKFSVEVARE